MAIEMDKKRDNSELDRALDAWEKLLNWAKYDKPLVDKNDAE